MAWQHQCVLCYCKFATIPQQTVWFFHKALEKFHGRRRTLKLASKPVLGRASKREKQMSGSNHHRYFYFGFIFTDSRKAITLSSHVCITLLGRNVIYTKSILPVQTLSMPDNIRWVPGPGIFGSGYAPLLATDGSSALWGPKVQRRWVVGFAPKQRCQDSYRLWNQPQLHVPTSHCEGLPLQGSDGEMFLLVFGGPFGLDKWGGMRCKRLKGLPAWQTLTPTKTTYIRVRVNIYSASQPFCFYTIQKFSKEVYRG